MKTILKAYHKNSDVVAYHKYEFNGTIKEKTFDKNGYILTSKYSTIYLSKYTRDKNGNVIAYKKSGDYYEIKNKTVTKEEYEEFINQIETN